MSLSRLFDFNEIFRIDGEFSDYSLHFAHKIIDSTISSLKEKDLTEKTENILIKDEELSDLPTSFYFNFINENDNFSTYHRPIEINNQNDRLHIKIDKEITNDSDSTFSNMTVKKFKKKEENINIEETASLNFNSFQKEILIAHLKTPLKLKLSQNNMNLSEENNPEKNLEILLKTFPFYFEEKISSEHIFELNTKNYEKRLICFPRKIYLKKIRLAKISIDIFASENDPLFRLFEYNEEIEFSTINNNNSNFFSSCEESKIKDFLQSNNFESKLSTTPDKDSKYSSNSNDTKLFQSNVFNANDSKIKYSSETIFLHQNERYNDKVQNYEEYEKQQSSIIENLKSEGCESHSEYENELNLRKVFSDQVDDFTSSDLLNLLNYQKNKNQLEKIETLQSLEIVRKDKSNSVFSKMEDMIKKERKTNPNNLKTMDYYKENISNRINEENLDEKRGSISKLAKRSLSCKPKTMETKKLIKENFIEKTYSFIDESKIILQGWLHKKSGNFIVGWQKRWFILTNEKLIYYKDEKKLEVKGFFNFKECKAILEEAKESFHLSYVEGTKKLHLKSKQERPTEKDWVTKIKELIEKYGNVKFFSSNEKNCLNLFWREDVISNDDFMKEGDSGDIILFHTNHLPAKLQRSVTGSKFDHVGMLYRDKNDLYVVDAQSDTGVSICPWKTFVYENDLIEKAVWRRLYHPNKNPLKWRLFEFFKAYLGTKYKLTAGKLLSRKSKNEKVNNANINNSSEASILQEKFDGFFCSELVAAALKKMGLLDPKISSSQYWPGSFSSKKKLKLLQGAQFSHEISILVSFKPIVQPIIPEKK